MTDHFKDCKNGDIITVVLQGEFERCGQRDCFVKKDGTVVCMSPDSPRVVSITVEPKPLEAGNRFTTREPREEGSIAGSYLQGEILFIAGDQAYVKYDHTSEYGNEYLKDIERE